MSKVKLFDFNRFAKLSRNHQPTLMVNPSDIVGVSEIETRLGHERKNGVYVSGNQCFHVSLTLQEIEDEINRALDATRNAHVKHEIEALAALKKLEEEINKNATQDAFKMNDFYPKGEN